MNTVCTSWMQNADQLPGEGISESRWHPEQKHSTQQNFVAEPTKNLLVSKIPQNYVMQVEKAESFPLSQ